MTNEKNLREVGDPPAEEKEYDAGTAYLMHLARTVEKPFQYVGNHPTKLVPRPLTEAEKEYAKKGSLQLALEAEEKEQSR